MIKTGVGNLFFSAANSYTGLTQINFGEIVVSHPDALGVSDASIAIGTVVNGGTLTLDDNVALATERLTLNGSGQAQAGALKLATGPGENASVAGPTTLASTSTVRVPAGQTLTPPVNGSGDVAPLSRTTIWAGQPASGLENQSFRFVVTFNRPAIAERSMYFGNSTRFAEGGHESAGVNELSSSWFLAEGPPDRSSRRSCCWPIRTTSTRK